MHTERRDGVAPKTTLNALGVVDKPRVEPTADIGFLEQEELEAVLRVTESPTDPALFLTAARTGMRQCELLALRWRDVAWPARRIRARRNHVRGTWGTPKRRRGSCAVPPADRLAAELEHRRGPGWTRDDDLVLCHRARGAVLDRPDAPLQGRAAAAGVRDVRVHDLCHTFGTCMAGAGVPLRLLREWRVIATSRSRSSTPTTSPPRARPNSSSAPSALTPHPGPIWGPNLEPISEKNTFDPDQTSPDPIGYLASSTPI